MTVTQVIWGFFKERNGSNETDSQTFKHVNIGRRKKKQWDIVYQESLFLKKRNA